MIVRVNEPWARQVLEEITGQLEEWRTEVAAHHQQSIAQATESAQVSTIIRLYHIHCTPPPPLHIHVPVHVQRVLAERRERVASERSRRVADHSERMRHLSEEKSQRKLMYSEDIELKSERSNDIAMGKKSCLEKVHVRWKYYSRITPPHTHSQDKLLV